jgi:hypothetical protein
VSVDLTRDEIDELRMRVAEEEAEWARIADDLVAELEAMPPASLTPKVRELLRLYQGSRVMARRLRRVIVVEVAG